MKITRGMYKNESCYILESEKLRVSALPQCGGKIQSVIYKPCGKELLFQSPGDTYRRSEYADPWGSGEISGFDEIFPTITPCHYPAYPWDGTHIPCHGEVWSIPWQAKETENGLFLLVHGVRLPYILSKTVALSDDGASFRQSYTVKNTAAFDMDIIWAAHPLFEVNENMRIELPPETTRIINVFSGSGTLGSYGSVHGWPHETVGRIGPRSNHRAEKFYVFDRIVTGSCALVDDKTGVRIEISYPAQKLPYLGVWINEAGLDGQYNAALEPCTSGYDRLDATREWGRSCVLGPYCELEWYLELSVSH